MQTVYNGQRTGNLTRQAEAAVLAGRETLAQCRADHAARCRDPYMNVLRDTAILDLQRRNVQVLQEQLKQTRDRFNVGEVTRTDVAQSESRVAASQSQVLAAEANLKASQAAYRRVVGVEPVNLRAGMPVDRLSPVDARGLDRQRPHRAPDRDRRAIHRRHRAIRREGRRGHALSDRHAGERACRSAGISHPAASTSSPARCSAASRCRSIRAAAEYSIIRQTKETLGQRRIELDVQRDLVRASVVQAWSQLQATKAQIIAAQAQVTATEVALNGVREEARVGQRTTLDVLNAQQELVNARVSLVTAQRDRVVASYTLLAAVGRLGPEVLGLKTEVYDPRVHYHQVRDKWIGVRTPDGR